MFTKYRDDSASTCEQELITGFASVCQVSAIKFSIFFFLNQIVSFLATIKLVS